MIVTDEMLADLKEVTLNALKFFKDFCGENNLKFFLVWGSCLGTVRHKGFIPWDDDIDICMPPEDYKKLLKLWPPQTSKGHYTLCDATETYCDRHTAMTIRDDNTTYIRPCDIDLDTHHGIMIEIGSLSYYPTSLFGKIRQTIDTGIYNIFRTQRVPNIGGGVQGMVIKVLLGLVRSPKARYKAWKRAEKSILRPRDKNTKLVRNVTTLGTLFTFYPVELFDEVAWLPFEDTEMPVPKEYDRYLRIGYGDDYMSPPPEDQRASVHDVTFLDCHNSYLKYKGTEYMLNSGRR